MNKYQRMLRAEIVDVYDVLVAFNVTNPAIQHAVKKLLAPGQRGHKSLIEDLREAIVSVERAIEITEEQAAAIATPPAMPPQAYPIPTPPRMGDDYARND